MACEGLPRQREGGQIESSANISYNDLDLVRNIESNGTTLVNYSYLADGTKLSADSSLILESEVVSAGMGFVSAGVVDTVEEGLKSMAKSAIGSQSTYEAVEKEVKAKIKSTGRNPKPGTVKSLVKADIQGMNDASEKTIHVSVEAVEGSIEFYNEIFDNDE